MSASFATYGFEPARLAERLRERGLAAALLTSPENVFYTTGYTTLPSAGNPILYMLRNRLPYYAARRRRRQGDAWLLGILHRGSRVRRGRDRPLQRFRRCARGAAGAPRSARPARPAGSRVHLPALRGRHRARRGRRCATSRCARTRSSPGCASSSLDANARGSSAASRSSSRRQPSCSTRCTSACRASS